jgi:hypothetical protein
VNESEHTRLPGSATGAYATPPQSASPCAQNSSGAMVDGPGLVWPYLVPWPVSAATTYCMPICLRQLGRLADAASAYCRAFGVVGNEPECVFLSRRFGIISGPTCSGRGGRSS